MAQRSPARRIGAASHAVVLGLGLLATGAPAAAESGLPPMHRTEVLAEPSGRVVSEADWAAALVDVLGLAPLLPDGAADADRFALLCPPGRASAGPRELTLQPGAGARVQLDVRGVPAGRYRLVVRGRGAGHWRDATGSLGVLDPSGAGVDVAERPVTVNERAAPIEAELAEGARVDGASLVPAPVGCIAPRGGWQAQRALTFAAKARTMVQAADLLGWLPSRGEGAGREGESYAAVEGPGARTTRALSAPASGGAWVEATTGPADFEYPLETPQAGTYSVMARLHGPARQVWSLDGGPTAPVEVVSGPREFGWSEVTTVPLEAGTHRIRARVPKGSGIDLLRVVPRRDDDADYVAVLEAQGFREGPPDAVVRRDAADRNLAALARLLDLPTARSAGLASVEGELEDLYRRPLSPILPGDL